MAKPVAAEKRQRRERGSINPDDIIKGAFELAEQVGIDNLSMPLLGKHLGVGVTSIYWYFRKKDDLLNAMTDRALKQYVFATPYVEAKDWRETLRNHARTMRKTFLGNPILCDLILIRSALSPRAAKLGVVAVEKAIESLVEAGLSPRTPSTRTPLCRCTCAVRLCCSASTTRIGRRTVGPGDFEETMVIDPETTPLLARVTDEGPPDRSVGREQLRIRSRLHSRPRGTADRRSFVREIGCRATSQGCHVAPEQVRRDELSQVAQTSTTTAPPWPPPAHIAATPMPPPLRWSS